MTPHGLHEALEAMLRDRAGGLQRAARFPSCGGSMACWARAGPLSRKDIDLYVKPEDAERALHLLVDAGMRAERPSEQWLFKAWRGEVLVDVIFEPLEGAITDERIAAADWMPVLGVWMSVASLEDVLVGGCWRFPSSICSSAAWVEIGRALRERIDWTAVRARTDASPRADAYFALLDGWGVIDAPDAPSRQAPQPDVHDPRGGPTTGPHDAAGMGDRPRRAHGRSGATGRVPAYDRC